MMSLFGFQEMVALKTLNLCIQQKVIIATSGVVFYVWQRGDRLIVAFDPNVIDTNRVNDDFAHRLSTRLEGRLVVRTNSRGMFLQVGLEAPPAPTPLDVKALDLAQQPGPWHMPIGTTKEGALWISLVDGDSFLVGGSRRKGKSSLTHGMIQALLHGGRTQVWAWDGKGGAEYQGYVGRENFHFISRAENGLKELKDLLADRLKVLKASGYPNIILHNAAGEKFIQPIALFVDEIAELEDPMKEALKRMIKLYGASGLYPVLATNDPTQAAILVKTNLSTRICFAVPSFNDSLTVLGMKGAEMLNERGRGLIIWDGRLTEFQSFQVTYPTPTEEQRRLLAEQFAAESEPQPAGDQIPEDYRQVLELIEQGETDAAIVRKVWNVTGGATFYRLRDRVAKMRSSGTSSSTSTPSGPVLGLEGAV